MAEDPFPRERVTAMVRRMPAYLKLAWRLTRDPLLSKARRAAVIGAAGYLASPVDLVPGVIPVLGQLDDIAVVLAAIRFALAGLSPEQRRAHLEAVGLADDLLMEDLRTTAAATLWIARAGVRTVNRVGRRAGTVAVAGARAAGPATRKIAGSAASAASSAASAASSAASGAGPAARGAAEAIVPGARRAAAKAGPATRDAAAAAAPAARRAASLPIPSMRLAFRRIPRRGAPREQEALPVEQEGQAVVQDTLPVEREGSSSARDDGQG